MGGRRPGPLCGTQDGFDLGTLCRAMSPIPGPLCLLREKVAKRTAIANGNHTDIVKYPMPKRHRYHQHSRRTPDSAVMAAINAELGTAIDFDMLAVFEGGQQLHGYIPGHTLGAKHDGEKVACRSGVTIATGFDIGQWDVPDLQAKLGLQVALANKYQRFCNKRKQAAVDELEKRGLLVEKFEADQTDMRVQRYHLLAAMESWNNAPKPTKSFTDLSSAQQTVILSRTYHQGIGMPHTARAKAFYSAARRDDWITAERELRNYNVVEKWYKNRVRQEADFLAGRPA